MHWTIAGLYVGRAADFGPKGEPSAIVKSPVDRAEVTHLGLAGDEQADLSVHGGHDKALHLYPRDHYDWWREHWPNLRGALEGGAMFGENLSVVAIDERDLSIGDRFRLGTALVEVSQGRQPCWKLGHRFGDPALVAAVVQSVRCGWYLRVIEPGRVTAGDAMTCVERPRADLTVDRVFRALFHPDPDRALLTELAGLATLAQSWRERALQRLRA